MKTKKKYGIPEQWTIPPMPNVKMIKENSMKYEIVDSVQTFKGYLDGKIQDDEIYVVNLVQGEVWGIPELCGADVTNEKFVFIKHT